MHSLTPPATRVDDGTVALRLCHDADLPAFEAAGQPGGNDGIWLIPVPGGPKRQLAAHIDSWPGQWPVGPALAIASSAGGRLVGIMYFTDRGAGSVEVTYGVAPAHRGQGIATRALRLAAAWLLETGSWSQVELRIADGATASQRVAIKAGFAAAGRVRTWVASAGREFDDGLYLMMPPHTLQHVVTGPAQA